MTCGYVDVRILSRLWSGEFVVMSKMSKRDGVIYTFNEHLRRMVRSRRFYITSVLHSSFPHISLIISPTGKYSSLYISVFRVLPVGVYLIMGEVSAVDASWVPPLYYHLHLVPHSCMMAFGESWLHEISPCASPIVVVFPSEG